MDEDDRPTLGLPEPSKKLDPILPDDTLGLKNSRTPTNTLRVMVSVEIVVGCRRAKSGTFRR